MQNDTEKSDASASRPRRRWPWILAALAAWMALCPSYLGRELIRFAIRHALNNPKAGLSCRQVEVDFSYAELLFKRRLRLLSLSGIRLDLSGALATRGAVAQLVTNRAITCDFRLTAEPKPRPHAMKAILRGQALDWPLHAEADLDCSYSTNFVTLAGEARVALKRFASEETSWNGTADFTASPGTWKAAFDTDRVAFDSHDDVLGMLIPRLPFAGTISNLVFAGELSLYATAEKPRGKPCPSWSADLEVENADASLETGGKPITVRSLSMHVGAAGISDHVDLLPLSLFAGSLAFGNLSATNAYARLLKPDDWFLVSEASVGIWGGRASLYALALDPAKLNAGFTLLLDDIDTGEALGLIPSFRAQASGRLHGKLPLFILNGRELRLRNAFLYSTPGETGTLRIEDPSPITENLAAAGLGEDVQRNLAKALAKLDYSALRIRLEREDEKSMALGIKIEGSASEKGVTVPVGFEVTFHGELEQLVNLGLRTATSNNRKKP